MNMNLGSSSPVAIALTIVLYSAESRLLQAKRFSWLCALPHRRIIFEMSSFSFPVPRRIFRDSLDSFLGLTPASGEGCSRESDRLYSRHRVLAI
jgi:hypothetical protein